MALRLVRALFLFFRGFFKFFFNVYYYHSVCAAKEAGCVCLCVGALFSTVITVFEIYDWSVYSVTF